MVEYSKESHKVGTSERVRVTASSSSQPSVSPGGRFSIDCVREKTLGVSKEDVASNTFQKESALKINDVMKRNINNSKCKRSRADQDAGDMNCNVPNGWSCPANSVDIIKDESNHLCLIRPKLSGFFTVDQSSTALVVANWPITASTERPLPVRLTTAADVVDRLSYQNYPDPSAEKSLSSLLHRLSSYYYYFEVKSMEGDMFIGFVTTPTVLNVRFWQEWRYHNNTRDPTKNDDMPNHFPVLSNYCPGICVNSVGLECSSGNLFVNGQLTATSDDFCLRHRALSDGDTLGCGLIIIDKRQHGVFFTLNGDVLFQGACPTSFHVDDESSTVFPAVGLTVGTKVVGNFGETPFLFQPFGRKPFGDEGNVIPRPQQDSLQNEANRKPFDDTIDYPSYFKDDVDTALKLSLAAPSSTDAAKETWSSPEEIEEIQDFGKDLRRLLQNNKYRDDLMDSLSDLCLDGKAKLHGIIEVLSSSDEADFQIIDSLCVAVHELNDVLAEVEALPNRPVPSKPFKSSEHEDDFSCIKKPNMSVNVDELIQKKDVFNLICLLRSESREKAAEALMKLAQEESELVSGGTRVRNEITSSGGLHSLLTIFFSCEKDMKLKRITALSVACLVPSANMVTSHKAKWYCVLKILECMRFLVHSDDCEERKCAAVAVTHCCDEMFDNDEVIWSDSLDSSSDNDHSSSRFLNSSRSFHGRHGKENRREVVEMQRAVKTAVSLVVVLAGSDIDTLDRSIPFAVDLMCAKEQVRPIIVREGIIKIIVQWLSSANVELVSSASNALKELSCPQCDYMAGYIHSEILREDAVPVIAKLCISPQKDVRLAIAQILSNLTVKQHTRAAIIAADGPSYLVQLLIISMQDISSNKWDDQVALAAGNALLRLLASSEVGQSEKEADLHRARHNFIYGIVQKGVLEPLVVITSSSNHGEARSVAVEILSLISDDTHSDHWTRRKLCDAGAAKGLAGNVLREGIQNLQISCVCTEPRTVELFHALRVLANLLEPSSSNLRQLETVSKEMADVGGLESLLSIVSLPIQYSNDALLVQETDLDSNDLLLESYRILASLCPLLLSRSPAKMGFSGVAAGDLAAEIVLQFNKTLELASSEKNGCNIIEDLQNYALRGLGSLAKCAPLKNLIVEVSLTQLIRLKESKRSITSAARAAEQVLFELGLCERDLVLIGNDPQALTDWFSFERSLLLQSMGVQEIKWILFHTWKDVLKERGLGPGGVTKRNPSASDLIMLQNIFPCLSDDLFRSSEHATLLQQYASMYHLHNNIVSMPRMPSSERFEVSVPSTIASPSNILTKEWVQLHIASIESMQTKYLSNTTAPSNSCIPMPKRVKDLFDSHYPSSIIQSEILPLLNLQSTASFNFIGFELPQRKYLSFRREGKVIQRFIKTNLSSTQKDTKRITLGFTNSTFGGEFTEFLLQTLYRCQAIGSLSFLNEHIREGGAGDLDSENRGDSYLSPVPFLVASLPPWVTFVTFDNFLTQKSLSELLGVLVSLSSKSPAYAETSVQNQLELEGLAIRNNVELQHINLDLFIDSLHLGGFPSLRTLDLSGNNLGDKVCGKLVANLFHDFSKCSVERLDLSGNAIGEGIEVLNSLKRYTKKRRQNMSLQSSSQLKMLKLASNSLGKNNFVEQIFSMLEHDALDITSLNLANNGITGDEGNLDEVLANALANNTLLVELDLSENSLRSNFFSGRFFSRIYSAGIHSSPLAFINVQGNDPLLADRILQELQYLMKRGRKELVDRHLRRELDPCVASVAQPVKASGTRFSEFVEKYKSPSSPIDNKLGVGNTRFERHSHVRNRVVALFSAPLVYKDSNGSLQSLGSIDCADERELLWRAFREASMDIDLEFDTATIERFSDKRTRSCSCLHYSGSVNSPHLTLEDGRGGMQLIRKNEFRNLILFDEPAQFNLVFVSMYNSYDVGESFVKAGVSHVVCCNRDSGRIDCIAFAFIRQFYLALAFGRTVKDAFDISRQAASILQSFSESGAPVVQWPSNGATDVASLFVKNCTENSKPTLLQQQSLPCPPQDFVGREKEMHAILCDILSPSNRFVSLLGESGVGLSSLALAVCNYINDRKSTMIQIDVVIFIRQKETSGRSLITSLYEKLLSLGLVVQTTSDRAEDASNSIVDALANVKALLVFDRVEITDGSRDAHEFSLFLNSLLDETKYVKVLITARKSIEKMTFNFTRDASSTIRIGPLNLKHTVTLFLLLCPHVQTSRERRACKERLCPSQKEDGPESKSNRDLYMHLGEGFPNLIIDRAYRISKEEFYHLLLNDFHHMQDLNSFLL